MKKVDLIAKPWEQISQEWKKNVTPPLSPSHDDIGIYRKILNKSIKNKNCNVLILGSTMEIRDLVGEYKKANIVVCDINLNHYLAMSNLTKNGQGNELFLRSEWSVAPFKHDFFDIIIGDGILSNVAKNNKDRFMINMFNLLKNNGLMVIREVLPDKNKHANMEEMLKAFSEYKINKNSPSEMVQCLSWSEYDPKKEKVSLKKINDELRKKYFSKKENKFKYPIKKIEDILNNNYLNKWLDSKKEWDVSNHKKIHDFFSKYFTIISVEHAKDNLSGPTCGIYGEVMPIWVLKKKK